MDTTADPGPTRQATAIVTTTPSVPMSVILLSVLVLVVGLAALGFAAIGDDDDSLYSCKEIPLPQAASSRPAHFDGDGNSVAVYTENGVIYVAALLDGTHGARIAPTGLGPGTFPVGGADVDGDGVDEGWIVRGQVFFPAFGELFGLLTFKPPCELALVVSPEGLRSAKPSYRVECRHESGADLVVTAPNGSRLYRLESSALVQSGGNPGPAQAGFHCGSLSRGWK